MKNIWPMITLESLVDPNRPITYGVVKPGEIVEDGVTFIRGGDIFQGRIAISNLRTISETKSAEYKRTILRGGELLISLVGQPGEVAIAPLSLAGANIARQVGLIALNNEINSQYMMYFFMSPMGRAILLAYMKGSVQIVINLADLRTIQVPVPPLSTQQKIATILSAYDDLIENNLRRIKILEEMAQNLYREWFVKFRFPGHENVRLVESPLGPIPKGWEEKRLDELVTYHNRSTEAGDHLNDRVYLPIDCIPRKSFAITEIKSWEEAQSSLILFNGGDILFGAMRPYFHKVIVAPFKGVTRKTCFVLNSIMPEYHAYSFLTLFQDSTVSYANAHSKGATIPYAVWNQSMDHMPVIVPPLPIASLYEEVVAPMLDRIGNIYFQNSNLRTTRNLLLPKLISGEIDVSNLDITVPEEVVT